jgi:hypothetical protein
VRKRKKEVDVRRERKNGIRETERERERNSL